MLRHTLSARPGLSAGLSAAALLGALAATDAARADVTVVSQVGVTEVVQPALGQTVTQGTPPPPRRESAHSPQTVTAYYKGGNARTEITGSLVTLYNGDEGKIYTIDPSQKTYYVRSVKDTLQLAPAQTKVDSNIDIKPGDDTKTLLGAPAHVYTVSGVVTLSSQRPGSGGGRGGGGHHRRGRGGGFPGGGGGFPGGGGGFPMLRQNGDPGGFPGDPGDGEDPENGGYSRRGGRSRMIVVSGELWLSDDLKLPDDRKASVLPALLPSVSGGDFVFKSLADNLGKKKEIPLESRLTLTHTDRRTNSQDSVTTTMHVISVTNTPLSDALFRLPLGLTQLVPPAPVTSDTGDSDPAVGP